MTCPKLKTDDEGGRSVAATPPRPNALASARPPTRTVTAKPTRLLSNNAINFIVDAILLLALMVVLTLTAIVQFILPDTPTATAWSLWSLNRTGWQRIQAGSIAVFGLLVLLHLILHWSWVCSFVTSRMSKALGRPVAVNESSKTIWGVATLIFVLSCIGAVLLIAEFCVVARK